MLLLGALGLFGVIGFQTIMLHPLHESLDLPAWDESNQMAWGAEFVAGSGTLKQLSASPLYNLFYALLTTVFGRIDSIFAMKYSLTLALSSLLFVMLAVYSRRVALPFLLCVLWSLSQFNLATTLGVYHFGLCLFVVAILVCNTSRAAALVLLLLACLVRLEYLFVVVPYGAYGLWAMRRSGARRLLGGRSSIAALMLLVALALYTAWHIERWDLGGSRSWHAFGQHYALAEREAGRTEVNPWLDYDAVLERDFPGSRTTLDALSSNPGAFGWHIVRNVALLPTALLELLTPYRLADHWPRYTAAWILILAAPLIALATRPREFLEQFRSGLSRLGDVALLGVLSPLAVLPCLVVRPKASYMLPLLPFLVLFVIVATRAALQSIGNVRRERVVGWVAGSVGVVLVCISSLSHRPYDEPDRPRPLLRRVTALESLWPEGRVKLMGIGASTYANYLGYDRCLAVEPFTSVGGAIDAPRETRLDRLIEIHRPDAVLINPWLIESRGFDRSSLQVLTPDRWQRHSLHGEEVFFKTQCPNRMKPIE